MGMDICAQIVLCQLSDLLSSGTNQTAEVETFLCTLIPPKGLRISPCEKIKKLNYTIARKMIFLNTHVVNVLLIVLLDKLSKWINLIV